MSTARRALGTGPATGTRTTTAAPAPRLLPAERAELPDDAEEGEDRAVRPLRGRRPLGTGIDRAR